MIKGNGTVINFGILEKEMEQLDIRKINWQNRFFISEVAHLTLKGHIDIENLLEESKICNLRTQYRDNQKRYRDNLCLQILAV